MTAFFVEGCEESALVSQSLEPYEFCRGGHSASNHVELKERWRAEVQLVLTGVLLEEWDGLEKPVLSHALSSEAMTTQFWQLSSPCHLVSCEAEAPQDLLLHEVVSQTDCISEDHQGGLSVIPQGLEVSTGINRDHFYVDRSSSM